MNVNSAATADCSVASISGRIEVLQGDVPLLGERVSQLVALLGAVRADLTADVMPRAARITGTLPRLNSAIGNVDAAIEATDRLLTELDGRGW